MVFMVGVELEWIIILVVELEYRHDGGGVRKDCHGGHRGRMDRHRRGGAKMGRHGGGGPRLDCHVGSKAIMWSLNGWSWWGWS